MASEFDLIRRYFTRPAKNALLGVGDDCALVRAPAGLALAISTDMLVAGTHFFADVAARALGHKTLAVNLSDIAAMGADPCWVTLAVALPQADEWWIADFAAGFFALADRFGVELIGGDTTRGPLTLNVTIIGTVPAGEALRRDGARPGDEVWLSGATGAAALAVAARRGEISLPEPIAAACARRLDWPEPRIALGRALRGLASSAIDISDGLLADLTHICQRSSVDIELARDAIPAPSGCVAVIDAARLDAAVLGGGDDYELAFTAPLSARGALEQASVATATPITRIGVVKPCAIANAASVIVRNARGDAIPLSRPGFDHFG